MQIWLHFSFFLLFSFFYSHQNIIISLMFISIKKNINKILEISEQMQPKLLEMKKTRKINKKKY